MELVAQVLEFAGLAAAVILAIIGYFVFWHYRHEYLMKRAARDMEQARLSFYRQKTKTLAQYASQGVNLEVSGEDFKAIVYFPQTLPKTIVQEIPEQKLLPAPQELLLPGPCDFADILDGWRPTPQSIMLALAPGGGYITVPLKSLCHVALAGATGLGKSVLMRLLLSQLIFVGARVILTDPHFAPVDPESGEDWRPIANRLAMPPSVSYAAITDVLRWLATDELPRRLERRRNGEHPGTPYFLAMDELPAIVKHVPEAPEYMGDLLREGRKVGLYLVSAAQDWLVKTVGGSGAVRDCFRTAFYVGGDATSARVLLDVKGRVDDGGLGKGIVMMRSSATPQAALSRIPYASNDALYNLLTMPTMEERDAVIVDEFEPDRDTPENVSAFPKQPSYENVNAPVEPTEMNGSARPKRYLFSDAEITAFVTGYRASGNVDKVLKAMGKGTVYRDTANRIIEVYGLRKEEA
jgi:Helicase HerA, central domain